MRCCVTPIVSSDRLPLLYTTKRSKYRGEPRERVGKVWGSILKTGKLIKSFGRGVLLATDLTSVIRAAVLPVFID